MSFSGLRVLVRNVNYTVHGVPAVVTPPSGGPSVSATVIWLTPETSLQPGGGELRRADARRGIAIRTSEVASIPRLTRILVAPAPGEGAVEFLTDSTDHVEHGEHRVTVVRRT